MNNKKKMKPWIDCKVKVRMELNKGIIPKWIKEIRQNHHLVKSLSGKNPIVLLLRIIKDQAVITLLSKIYRGQVFLTLTKKLKAMINSNQISKIKCNYNSKTIILWMDNNKLRSNNYSSCNRWVKLTFLKI